MSSVNKAILVGHLGSDPEIREVGDKLVVNVSLATSETFTKNGEKQKSTEWHRLVFWSPLAEIVDKYLGKGDLIYVEGKISTRQYEAKDGGTKSVTEIRVFQMQMLQTQKQDEPVARTATAAQRQPAPARRTAPQAGPGYDDQEVGF